MWAAVAWLALALVAMAGGRGAEARGPSCGEARLKCAYRAGCGAALNNYMELCADVLAEPAKRCPKPCQHALIALATTDEGKDLMNCECENDEYCEQTKKRIEVCRAEVSASARSPNATASCHLSQLICVAEVQCATALGFYHRFCRAMYRGRRCSGKCLNSIGILRKQPDAAALTACRCDGHEDYDCPRMQNNLARLCFHRRDDARNGTRHHEHDGPAAPRDKGHHHRKADAAGHVSASVALLVACSVWGLAA